MKLYIISYYDGDKWEWWHVVAESQEQAEDTFVDDYKVDMGYDEDEEPPIEKIEAFEVNNVFYKDQEYAVKLEKIKS